MAEDTTDLLVCAHKLVGLARFVLMGARPGVTTDGMGRLDRFPRIRLRRGSSLHLARRTRLFSGVCFETRTGQARIAVGERTYLNRNSQVIAWQSVQIGADCAIAWDVLITDSDEHHIDFKPVTRPVVIEDGVWIGARAVILKGVRVGAGSVVGAGAVVSRSVPPRSLVVGNPAQVVRTGVRWGAPSSVEPPLTTPQAV